MPWQLTDDVEAYAARAWELLAARPAENTAALTVIESVRAGHAWSEERMAFGWFEDADGVTGAASLTPPYELLLAVVPEGTDAELAAALRAAGVAVPGVNGDPATTDGFAAAWTAGTTLRAETAMRQRLYRLEALRQPAPPAGRARPAEAAELDLAVRWLRAFGAEAGAGSAVVESMVRARIAGGRMWLWEDPAGTPVALAARTPPAAGVARIAPVYTPPEHRRRGYGAAVTAACVADALQREAGEIVLFTDLDNPTSNSIYRQIGFRPLGNRQIVRFSG